VDLPVTIRQVTECIWLNLGWRLAVAPKVRQNRFKPCATAAFRWRRTPTRQAHRRLYSKKLSNLRAHVALHFAHYNFVRIHETLRCTPAMAAGLTDRLWGLEELIQSTA